jgi:hypothetical protein
VERLLFSAMIEARSCERFKVLSENIQDEELSVLQDLMESEGSLHHFYKLCQKIWNRIDVENAGENGLNMRLPLLQTGKRTRFMGNIVFSLFFSLYNATTVNDYRHTEVTKFSR